MTDITADDEREVMDWLTRHAALDNDGWRSKYARTILALLSAAEAGMQETRTVPDDVVLTLVSQARQRARDAALEEAEQVALRHADAGHLADVIANRIAALRRPA